MYFSSTLTIGLAFILTLVSTYPCRMSAKLNDTLGTPLLPTNASTALCEQAFCNLTYLPHPNHTNAFDSNYTHEEWSNNTWLEDLEHDHTTKPSLRNASESRVQNISFASGYADATPLFPNFTSALNDAEQPRVNVAKFRPQDILEQYGIEMDEDGELGSHGQAGILIWGPSEKLRPALLFVAGMMTMWRQFYRGGRGKEEDDRV